MLPALAAALAELPADRPRYLMGVGDPVSMLEAIALGVDMFDCVLPTRLARHGTALTGSGRLSVRAAALSADSQPLEPGCGCPVCERWSRAYLRHLLSVGEPAAARLLTLHNLAWVLTLLRRARQAITEGSLERLLAEVAASWP
jgi:queuine tRNA-ribosyltransferase